MATSRKQQCMQGTNGWQTGSKAFIRTKWTLALTLITTHSNYQNGRQ
jgi:hypothetical protein